MKRIILIALYFLSPLIPILAVYNADPEKYQDSSQLLFAMILGVAAYTWFALEFVLIARPKFVEKYFGMDKFYRFHGQMAVVALIVVFSHKLIYENLHWGGRAKEYGETAFNIFAIITGITLIFMVDSILLKIKAVSWIKSFFARITKLKYEHYVAVHSLTVLGLILMYVHVILTSTARESMTVKFTYSLYFTMGFGFYLYHRLLKFILLKRKRFIVEDVTKESETMYTIRLVPENGMIFRYKPGQFGFFRIFDKNVKPEEHPFSISSEPTNKEFLDVTIKELGDYTSTVKKITQGAKVFVDGPYGRFSYLEHPKEQNLVLIAGGVGITPMFSMIRYIYKNEKSRNVTLIWGARNKDELIRWDEFMMMQSEMKNFVIVPVLSDDDSWGGEKGFIGTDKIIKFTGNLNGRNTGYYLCGPATMSTSVLKSLKELGVKRKNIHYEKFYL